MKSVSKEKRLCIFDLDGTLINSIDDISYAVNRGLKILGLPQHETYKYYHFVGNGMKKLCERSLPSANKYQSDKLLDLYSDYYIKHCTERTVPYDGIINFINKLKEYDYITTAILSNKPHEQTLSIVNHIFGDNIFDMVLGQKEEYPIKPDPTLIQIIMKELGFDSSNTINIGDSDVDVILGKNADISTIGVSWGFRGEEELKKFGACYIAHNTDELLEYILK